MATKTSDSRIVKVTVTVPELTTLLGQRAQQAGIIDFEPDLVEVYRNGDSYDCVFEKLTIGAV